MNSTTLLRFRVQTIPPLEDVKAWHSVLLDSNIKHVQELTSDIALTLGLHDDGQLSLELDGFALLPSSPIGVVRDGDLITVRRRAQSEKRKTTAEAELQRRKRHKTRSPSPAWPSTSAVNSSKSHPPESSEHLVQKSVDPPLNVKSHVPSSSELSSSSSESSDEESSSSEDSSSESESSDSESESDSDSNSDTDSDGPPQSQPIARKATITRTTSKPKSSTSVSHPPKLPNPLHPPVPPGLGKQSTQDRNARRRLLQKHKAAGTAIVPSRAQSTAPIVTSVAETSSATVTVTAPAAPIAPAKNSNKNKRRGFDQDMATRVATRTVFDDSRVSATPLHVPSPPPIEPASRSRYTHYHVVPPSQLPNLPSNVIVTSVDVEAVDGMEGVGEWFDGEAEARGGEAMVKDVETDQVMEDIKPGEHGATEKVDWDLVDGDWEERWETFKVLVMDDWMGLKIGTLLGWKDLMIDPATFTPATKIHLARVTGSPDLGANQTECLMIERPGAGNVGFGFGGRFGGDEMEEDNECGPEVGETRMVAAGEMESWRVMA